MTNNENIGVARPVNILICTNFILKVNTALVKKKQWVKEYSNRKTKSLNDIYEQQNLFALKEITLDSFYLMVFVTRCFAFFVCVLFYRS